MLGHRFPYRWTLKNAKFTKGAGTVFSCFAGVGGSTMGYKLAGFDVIGMNEVDERMAECYIANHRPKYRYIEPIQDFKVRENLPKGLYRLDILDGSPPCSPFSLCGKKIKDWTKEMKFREGGIRQRIDLLFFDFIDLARKLNPKVVVAENVPAILLGDNMEYVRRIYREFGDAGYFIQHFVLDSSKMGVPQKRRRIFFVALRNDLVGPFLVGDGLLRVKPKLILKWDEPIIKFRQMRDDTGKRKMTAWQKELLKHRIKSDGSFGDISLRLYGKLSGFNKEVVRDHLVCPTVTTNVQDYIRDCDSLLMTDRDIIRLSTFPSDFNFCETGVAYACGMGVPPVMMAQIATEIHRQWLSKLGQCADG